jgi:proline iminopeptidase
MESEGFVTVAPNLRLYYRWLSERRDHPIVVPAAAWWGHQLDRLADDHAVLLYDPRGRGRSDPRPATRGSLDDEIDDLERLREALRIDRMSLIGWSFLGAVVALYAARYPERVSRLVQVGPMVPRRDPYWTQFITDYSARSKPEYARLAGGSVWGPTIAPQLADPEAAAAIINSLDLTSPNEDPAKIGAWAATLMGQQPWDWRDEARKVTAPALTVHGVRDNLPVDASREWAAAFPSGRLVLIDDAGHYPHFEQPQAFMKALAEFFADT